MNVFWGLDDVSTQSWFFRSAKNPRFPTFLEINIHKPSSQTPVSKIYTSNIWDLSHPELKFWGRFYSDPRMCFHRFGPLEFVIPRWQTMKSDFEGFCGAVSPKNEFRKSNSTTIEFWKSYSTMQEKKIFWIRRQIAYIDSLRCININQGMQKGPKHKWGELKMRS